MTSKRESARQADVQRHVDDLVRVLTGKNADRILVEECLEHLSTILETLGERSAATSVRKELKNKDDLVGRVSDSEESER